MKEIELITVPGQFALEELDQALQEARETGFHPILQGDAADYELVLEGMEQGDEPDNILREAEKIVVPEWFERRIAGTPLPCDDDDCPSESGSDAFLRIVTHLDPVADEPKPEVLIRNFKVPDAWHAFAHLAWGGWNKSPTAAEHCAIHRYWAEQYGAEVVSITSNEVQCRVSRPPTDRESAIKLAQAQYVYCEHVVDQANQSITALAASLVNSKYWYFCWE